MIATDTIIQDTINAMQALHAGVDGVENAPQVVQYPTAIDTAARPYVITWPGPATWHHEGMGGSPRRQDRTMFVLCYIDPLGQNDIPTRLASGILVMQRLVDVWLTPSSIALHNPTAAEPWQTTVEESSNSPHSDEGIVSNLMFRGVPWTGFQLSVRVRIKWGFGGTLP